MDEHWFQTLIGILQTIMTVSTKKMMTKFQTLIGILQTIYPETAILVIEEFQTLIGILQTALFLALFKLLSSF